MASSKNKTLLVFCFCFITGASLFSWIPSLQILKIMLFGLLLTTIGLLVSFRKKPHERFIILGSLFLLFGAWRAAIVTPSCRDENNLCFYNDKMVQINGVILDEPDRRIDKTNYIVTVSTLGGEPINGRVLMTTKNYPEYQYGDEIEVTCRLQAPENKEGSTFRYDKYLAKENIFSLCASSVILSGAKDLPNTSTYYKEDSSVPQNDNLTIIQLLMKHILLFKNTLDSQVSRLWPQPESGLMAGILYGSRSGLPPEIVENFSNTGVTHIIAVSGFNITIIATILMSTLITLGLWRKQAFWVALVSVWLFTTLSGLSASVVRAAIMGTLSLVAVRIGRKNEIGTVLIFTAAVMLAINPFLLIWDAGFQLSFLATIGLVYISPLLENVIQSVRLSPGGGKDLPPVPLKHKRKILHFIQNDIMQKVANVVGEPLLTTLSAIIITLPLILYQFGRLSLVAPLVNILILWIVPWLMLGGFVAVVVSIVFFPLGQVVAYASNFGLDYVIKVTKIFGEWSWSSVNLALPWWAMVCSYIFLFYYVQKSQSLRFSQRIQSSGKELR